MSQCPAPRRGPGRDVHQPRVTETTHHPVTGMQPARRRALWTPPAWTLAVHPRVCSGPTVEPSSELPTWKESHTEKLQGNMDAKGRPPSPQTHPSWAAVHLLQHSAAHVLCTRTPRAVLQAEWFSFWLRLTFSRGQLQRPDRDPLACASRHRGSAPLLVTGTVRTPSTLSTAPRPPWISGT